MTPTPELQMHCASCGQPVAAATTGWECECGVRVCGDSSCFEEYFKHVAGGEATRCFTCGTVS